MGLTRVTPEQVNSVAVAALDLDDDAVDLFSAEALAASLRRAASFLCPTTPAALVRAVEDAVARLPGVPADLREQLETLLGALISYGDLLELQLDADVRTRRHLFLGPPAFVQRASGACLLIGIRPDGAPLLSDDTSRVRLPRRDSLRSVKPLVGGPFRFDRRSGAGPERGLPAPVPGRLGGYPCGLRAERRRFGCVGAGLGARRGEVSVDWNAWIEATSSLATSSLSLRALSNHGR